MLKESPGPQRLSGRYITFASMDYDLGIFTHASAWVSLITLTFLEIVLGVDNIIFISLTANKLPQHRRAMGRNIGLLIALGIRFGHVIGDVKQG